MRPSHDSVKSQPVDLVRENCFVNLAIVIYRFVITNPNQLNNSLFFAPH